MLQKWQLVLRIAWYNWHTLCGLCANLENKAFWIKKMSYLFLNCSFKLKICLMIHSANIWVTHVQEYALKLINCLFKLGQVKEAQW